MTWFLIIVVLLLLMVAIGVPVAFALGASALVVLLIIGVPPSIVPLAIFNAGLSFPLLAIPLFMFVGALMEKAEIADALVDFASSLVGFMRGGLAMVNVVVSMFFAGMSGSSASDVASIGSILIPQMKRKGYPGDFSVAVTSFSASMALIIPPSIHMIIFGVVAGVSIVKLFIAGIIPGLIVGGGQIIMCYLFAVKHKYPVHEAFELRRVSQTFNKAVYAFSIPVIILGGILGGIFTVTESAAMAAVATFLLALTVYRGKLNLKKMKDALLVTARRTAIIMLMIAASGLFARFLAIEQVPQRISQGMISFTDNPLIIFAMLNILFAVIGCFIGGGAAIIILAPILMPLIKQLGIDPLHFGIVMVLNLDMGTQTPPVGPTMLLACVIGEEKIEDVFRVNKYFLMLGFGVVLLVTYVPSVALWLPSLLK